MTTTSTDPENTLYPLVPGREYWATTTCTCGCDHKSESFRVRAVRESDEGRFTLLWPDHETRLVDGDAYEADIYAYCESTSDPVSWAFGSDADRIDFEPMPYETTVASPLDPESEFLVSVDPRVGGTVEFRETDGYRFGITVYGPETRFGSPEPARVNWAGCGSQSVVTTRVYAEALLAATKIAEDLNEGKLP